MSEGGKPEVGRLSLKAYQQGGNIYIEIGDDGTGLNRERIVAKAVELGLAPAGEPLGDEQVCAFILQPGFSTTETVTEVSGRGVGMDVVKRNLDALGGSVQIQSEPGRGTTFRLKPVPKGPSNNEFGISGDRRVRSETCETTRIWWRVPPLPKRSGAGSGCWGL